MCLLVKINKEVKYIEIVLKFNSYNSFEEVGGIKLGLTFKNSGCFLKFIV